MLEFFFHVGHNVLYVMDAWDYWKEADKINWSLEAMMIPFFHFYNLCFSCYHAPDLSMKRLMFTDYMNSCGNFALYRLN